VCIFRICTLYVLYKTFVRLFLGVLYKLIKLKLFKVFRTDSVLFQKLCLPEVTDVYVIEDITFQKSS